MTKIIYSWNFNSKKQRGNLWYISIISIAIGFIIWGFITKIYGLSFVIMILAGLMYFIENNSPDEINVSINELGIKIGNNFYDFGDIKSFTMIYEGMSPLLIRLNLNKKGLKHLDLFINQENANDIRNTLLNFIQENSREQLTFIEKITKLLKL